MLIVLKLNMTENKINETRQYNVKSSYMQKYKNIKNSKLKFFYIEFFINEIICNYVLTINVDDKRFPEQFDHELYTHRVIVEQ